DIGGPLDVDPLEAAAAVEVPGQGDEGDDSLRSGQRRSAAGRLGDVTDPDLEMVASSGREPSADSRSGRLRTHQGQDPMPTRDQLGADVTADEAACAGYENGGHGLSVASPRDPNERPGRARRRRTPAARGG